MNRQDERMEKIRKFGSFSISTYREIKICLYKREGWVAEFWLPSPYNPIGRHYILRGGYNRQDMLDMAKIQVDVHEHPDTFSYQGRQFPVS